MFAFTFLSEGLFRQARSFDGDLTSLVFLLQILPHKNTMLTRSTKPADRLRIYAQAVIDCSLAKDNFFSLSFSSNDAF